MYTIRRNTIIREGDGLVCFRSHSFEILKTKCDVLNELLPRYIGGGRNPNYFKRELNQFIDNTNYDRLLGKGL